jgi:hypothetical protein
VFGYRFDPNSDIVHSEVDWRYAVRFGEAEEGIRHEILYISRREITRQSPKELELIALGAEAVTRRHRSATA